MINSLPTVKADSSEARKITALAISLGLPKRLAGIWFWSASEVALRLDQSNQS
jgi:hypothetical protein